MTKRFPTILIFLALTLAIAGDSKSPTLEWLPLEKAMKTAQAQKKPLYVYLYSTYCGWCKRFDAQTLSDAQIISLLGDRFVLSKINTASTATQEFEGKKLAERQLAAMFAVRGVPASAFMDSSGKLIAKLPGYMPPDKFMTVLKYVGDGWYSDMTYQEFMDSEEKIKKDGNNK